MQQARRYDLDTVVDEFIITAYREKKTSSINAMRAAPIIMFASDEGDGAILPPNDRKMGVDEILHNVFQGVDRLAARSDIGTVESILCIGEIEKAGKRYAIAEGSTWKGEFESRAFEITENEAKIPVLRESEEAKAVIPDSIVRLAGVQFWNRLTIRSLGE